MESVDDLMTIGEDETLQDDIILKGVSVHDLMFNVNKFYLFQKFPIKYQS